MPERVFVIAALVLLAFLLATNIYRAAHQSITVDEAFTYSWVAAERFWWFEGDVSNNHVLHTLLCKLSVKLFGLSEFTFRLPSLLGGLLYFIALFRLATLLFGRSIWFFLTIALNSLNPLILDFLSAARGYGIGLAFFTFGLYYTLRRTTTSSEDRSLPIKAGAAWGLAGAAQLTYIPPALAIAGVAILVWRNRRDAIRMIATAAAIGCAFLAWPMRHAKPDDFYVGVATLEESVDALVKASLAYKQTVLTATPLVRTVFIDWLKPLLGTAAVAIAIFWGRSAKRQKSLSIILGGSLVWYLLLRIVGVVNSRPFPPDRAGLFIYLVTSLAVLLALQGLEERRVLRFGGAVILFVFTLLFALQYNVDYYLVYRVNAGDKAIFKSLRNDHAADRKAPVQVGADWLLMWSVNFYRSMYKTDWMDAVRWEDPDCYYDYYVLRPGRDAIAARYGATALYRDSVGGATLAKASDSILRPPPTGAPPCAIDPAKLTSYARFTEPGAKAHVARGMVDGSDLWTFNRILLFFRVGNKENARFKMRFNLNPAVFSHTGPLTMTILMNGKQFAQAAYDRSGDHTFEQLVPAEFFGADSLTAVDIRMDKYYLSPIDGAKVDLWLFEAGFAP